ncbi:MAG: beta-lactamase family protein [Verrucomicrobiae bacterium]|nr:beta-lactamase family protein [Verrucomicrobiae bacterium]
MRNFFAVSTAIASGIVSGDNGGEDLMKPFDEEVENFMKPRFIPGASLAVFNNGSIVYEKAYGFADIDKKTRTTNSTLFRIASLSKPLTAVGILKLVEQNKLNLDAPIVELLKGLFENFEEKITDKRWFKITVRHLLQHTGGWDSALSGDPMFFSQEKIGAVIGRTPRSPVDIIEFMLSRKLDFDPGARYAYSNFGYCVLGRVIEQTSRMRYEDYIKQNILKPLSIENMHLGATNFEKRRTDESIYYTAFNNEEMKNLHFNEKSNPYGSFQLERMDAHGGWISTAFDYARFCIALTEKAKKKILTADSWKTLVSIPEHLVKEDKKEAETYYGCGWQVRPLGKNGKPNLWHYGSLPGTFSFAAVLGDGTGWVVLFNGRSVDESLPGHDIDSALHRAAGKIKELPSL